MWNQEPTDHRTEDQERHYLQEREVPLGAVVVTRVSGGAMSSVAVTCVSGAIYTYMCKSDFRESDGLTAVDRVRACMPIDSQPRASC